MIRAFVVPSRAAFFRVSASVLIVAVACALAATAHAGEPKLVKDIERTSHGCETSRFLPGDGALYFGTDRGCRFGGLALWRTDGTHAGTRVVASFEPGPRDLDGVQAIASIGGLVYFGLRSSDGLAGVVELWRSDGTAADPVRLWEGGPDERIYSSFLSERPGAGQVGGKLVFVVDHGYQDATLWVTDGTPQGTHTLPDLADGRFTVSYLESDGALFLVVWSDAGYALWRTDGTAVGTVLVRPIGLGLGGDLGDRIALGPDGAVYYVVPHAPGVSTLWRSWGTPATSSPVLDIPFASYWVLAEGVHYVLEARRVGVRLWRFDPVGLDLELLKVLEAAPVGDNDLDFLGAADGVAYFSHFAWIGSRERLWRSDGTPDGTVKLFDELLRGGFFRTATGFAFVPDFEDEPAVLWHTDGTVARTEPILELPSPYYDDFTPIDDEVALFLAGSWATTLMRTDGTAAGTLPLGRVTGNAWNFGVHDGVGIFVAASTLWRSDGTTGGTYRLAELGLETVSANPREMVGVDGSLLFVVGGTIGLENDLWRSDGTRTGTRRVRAFPEGSEAVRSLTRTGNGVTFARGASELWTSDGTTPGTVLLGDLAAGTTAGDGARIEEIAEVGGGTFVAVRARNGIDGALWRSHGSSSDPELVVPLAASSLTSFDGALHFSAPSDQRVAALWRSDGSAAGTVPLATFSALNRRRRPEIGPLFANADALFFSVARRGRTDLWQSDGSEGGTSRITALPTHPQSSEKLGVHGGGFVGGRFVFGYRDYSPGSAGRNLWSSDGTAVGTAGIAKVSEYGTPTDFVRVGEHLVFRNQDPWPDPPVIEDGLWTTDGTEIGTERLLDAVVIGKLTVVGDVAYFCSRPATDERARLWRTDGTVAGTAPAFDRALWCDGEIEATRERLFLSASTRRYGTELWSALLDTP